MELAIRNVSKTNSNGVQALPLRVRRGKRRRWAHEVPGDFLFRDGLPDAPPTRAYLAEAGRLSTWTAALVDNGGYGGYFLYSPNHMAGVPVINSNTGPFLTAGVIGEENFGEPTASCPPTLGRIGS